MAKREMNFSTKLHGNRAVYASGTKIGQKFVIGKRLYRHIPECASSFILQFRRNTFPDDKLRRGVVLDMPDYLHDVVGIIHHLAKVYDVTALHCGEVVPAVLLTADLERRMSVLPVRSMVKRVCLVIAYRAYAYLFKITDEYLYLQDVQSVLAPGIAAAFLMGICWKRASAQGGMWGLIAGLVIGLTRLGAKVYYSNATVVPGSDSNLFQYLFYDTNWLFFCGWMLVFCLLVVIIVSLLTKAPDQEKIRGLVFGTSTPEQRAATRASWNHWDVIHTVIILGITAAFYYYFW